MTAHGNGFLSAYSALKFYRYLKKHPEEMENNKAEYISETEECNKKREERKEKERKEFEKRQNNRKSNDTDSSILDDILSKL
jgi:predicted phage gp36 major capsid-like protein